MKIWRLLRLRSFSCVSIFQFFRFLFLLHRRWERETVPFPRSAINRSFYGIIIIIYTLLFLHLEGFSIYNTTHSFILRPEWRVRKRSLVECFFLSSKIQIYMYKKKKKEKKGTILLKKKKDKSSTKTSLKNNTIHCNLKDRNKFLFK